MNLKVSSSAKTSWQKQLVQEEFVLHYYSTLMAVVPQ